MNTIKLLIPIILIHALFSCTQNSDYVPKISSGAISSDNTLATIKLNIHLDTIKDDIKCGMDVTNSDKTTTYIPLGMSCTISGFKLSDTTKLYVTRQKLTKIHSKKYLTCLNNVSRKYDPLINMWMESPNITNAFELITKRDSESYKCKIFDSILYKGKASLVTLNKIKGSWIPTRLNNEYNDYDHPNRTIGQMMPNSLLQLDYSTLAEYERNAIKIWLLGKHRYCLENDSSCELKSDYMKWKEYSMSNQIVSRGRSLMLISPSTK